jgi:hypothetical protein
MFRTALQPHFKNKMMAQQDERRVEVLFILRALQAHVDVQLCLYIVAEQCQILEWKKDLLTEINYKGSK